jgi:hypothetical protein
MSGMGVLLCMCDRGAIEFLLHTQGPIVGLHLRVFTVKEAQAPFPPHPFSSTEFKGSDQ